MNKIDGLVGLNEIDWFRQIIVGRVNNIKKHNVKRIVQPINLISYN